MASAEGYHKLVLWAQSTAGLALHAYLRSSAKVPPSICGVILDSPFLISNRSMWGVPQWLLPGWGNQLPVSFIAELGKVLPDLVISRGGEEMWLDAYPYFHDTSNLLPPSFYDPVYNPIRHIPLYAGWVHNCARLQEIARSDPVDPTGCQFSVTLAPILFSAASLAECITLSYALAFCMAAVKPPLPLARSLASGRNSDEAEVFVI